MTASHNPGGIDADFGIKFNCSNGGPAPSSVTDKIFEISKSIVEFKSVNDGLEVNLDEIGAKTFEVVRVAACSQKRAFWVPAPPPRLRSRAPISLLARLEL